MIFVAYLLWLGVVSPAIEISLEENKAESGTIGYVDIKKIFARFSSQTKAKFSREIKKRQDEVDLKKKELLNIRARRERLMWEYEIAKMYEEFVSRISTTTQETVSNPKVEISTVSLSTAALEVIESTATEVSQSISTAEVETAGQEVSQTNSEEDSQPYITMPGVGKVPISLFRFSVSSSPVVIEFEIKRLEKEASEIENAIIELKEKYDKEIASEIEKENFEVFKRIYQAIEEVSKREGISVVVDKRNILFGMKSIDLTEKVIETIEKDFQ